MLCKDHYLFHLYSVKEGPSKYDIYWILLYEEIAVIHRVFSKILVREPKEFWLQFNQILLTFGVAGALDFWFACETRVMISDYD